MSTLTVDKLGNLRRALAWLESKEGLSGIQWTLRAKARKDGGYDLELETHGEGLDGDKLRAIKRHFGPLKVTEGYGYKNLTGQVTVSSEVAITVTINRAYVCQQVDPAKLTEESWDSLKEKVRQGVVTVSDCKPTDSLAESL